MAPQHPGFLRYLREDDVLVDRLVDFPAFIENIRYGASFDEEVPTPFDFGLTFFD